MAWTVGSDGRLDGQVLTTSFAHFTAGLIFVFDNVANSKGLKQKTDGVGGGRCSGRKREGTAGRGNVMGCVLVLDGKGNVVEIKCTATTMGTNRRGRPTVSADRWSRCDYAGTTPSMYPTQS